MKLSQQLRKDFGGLEDYPGRNFVVSQDYLRGLILCVKGLEEKASKYDELMSLGRKERAQVFDDETHDKAAKYDELMSDSSEKGLIPIK